MSRFRLLLPLAVLVLLPPPRAAAWGEVGHATVAKLAWDRMTDGQKLKAAALLKSHPHYKLFLAANRQGQPGLSYSTISHRLAQDVQHLLLRFGLVATLRTKRSRVNDRPYTAYEVVLLGIGDVQRFLRTVGIAGREAACAQIERLEPPVGPSTWRDTIPTGPQFWRQLGPATGDANFAEISRRSGVKLKNRRHGRPLCRATVGAVADAYPDPRLHALAYGDVYWDEIASIRPDGEAPVYDLTVPEHANFVANDLVLHNSTLLCQVASRVSSQHGRTLYVTGEESVQQVKMRAERLEVEEFRRGHTSLVEAKLRRERLEEAS